MIKQETDIYKILVKQIDFLMYSVPGSIYEEVRSILIEKGLQLIKIRTKEYLLPRLYKILVNTKISEMRKYYANKDKYNQSFYQDGITIPGCTEFQLDKIDTGLKFKEQMEVLYTAIRRMTPVQKRLIRMFFKLHNERRNYFQHSNFIVRTKAVIQKTGTNRRRGYEILSEIRGILKQVILERREGVSTYSSVRVETFNELWKGIKGGNR